MVPCVSRSSWCPCGPQSKVWASPAPQSKPGRDAGLQTGRQQQDTQNGRGTLQVRPPVLPSGPQLQMGHHLSAAGRPPPAPRMGTRHRGVSFGKSPPGENSRQLEKENSLFCASSFNEQETQQKSPPGHSGLRKAMHTPLWGQAPTLCHSPVPSTVPPGQGAPIQGEVQENLVERPYVLKL